MIAPTCDLLENIELLIEHADPEGEAFARLTRYRAHVLANVMLGPGPRSYIASLFARLENIECEHLDSLERCKVYGGACNHAERFSRCPAYKAQRGEGD